MTSPLDWFDTPDLYGTHDCAWLAGVEYRQLDFWDRAHAALVPAVPATGSGGGDRLYTLKQACEARVAGIMARSSVPVAVIRRALDNLRNRPHLWSESVIVVVDRAHNDREVNPVGAVLAAAATAENGLRVDLPGCLLYVQARLSEWESAGPEA